MGWQFWRRKKAVSFDKKSYTPYGGLISYLDSYDHSDLQAYAAIQLYNTTAPLQNAIEIIASEVSSLTPILKVLGSEEVVKDHPVLDLLNFPNAAFSGMEFMSAAAGFFLATGNNYFSATGEPKREPLELYNLYPQSVQPRQNVNDGFAAAYDLRSMSGQVVYKREEVSGRFRYYYGDERELWHMRRFNPTVDTLTGQPLSSSLLSEIDQFNASSAHNVSLLKRGARPSGLLLASGGLDREGRPVGGLTDEQYNRLRTQLDRYMGAGNAGKVFIVDGVNVDYKNMIVSNRDMDFLEGRKDVRQSIYTHFSIPLPMITGDRQTFSNLESSNGQLYDNAVLPVADMVFQSLSLFLLPRYKDGDKYELTYDDSVIPALMNRKTREIKEKSETGIYTINELRTIAGMEALDEGGDVLYRPSSMVPIAQDQYTDDQLTKPKASAKRFREILIRKGYSEDKIQEMSTVLRLRS